MTESQTAEGGGGKLFIALKFDFCKALFSGVSKRNIHRLQFIQNAAAQPLTHC